MNTIDLRETLHDTILLREFTEQEMDQFLPLLDPLSAKAGEIVVPQDEVGDSMFVLVRGNCRVAHYKDGCEVELATLREGDFFGELALIDRGPRSADVIAISDVALLKVLRLPLLNSPASTPPPPSSYSWRSAALWWSAFALRTSAMSIVSSSFGTNVDDFWQSARLCSFAPRRRARPRRKVLPRSRSTSSASACTGNTLLRLAQCLAAYSP